MLFRKQTHCRSRLLLYFMELLQEQQSLLGIKNRQVSDSRVIYMVIYDLLLPKNKRVPQTLLIERAKPQYDWALHQSDIKNYSQMLFPFLQMSLGNSSLCGRSAFLFWYSLVWFKKTSQTVDHMRKYRISLLLWRRNMHVSFI